MDRLDNEPLTLENMKKSGEQLIEKKQIGKSPIIIVGNKEKGYAATLGQHRLTKWYKTIKELETWMNTNQMEMTCLIAATTYEMFDNIKKETQKSANKILKTKTK